MAMKRFDLMLMAVAVLSAVSCTNDSDIDPWRGWDDPEFTGMVSEGDMERFLNDIEGNIWDWTSYEITYTDGSTASNMDFVGGTHVDNMMFLPDGTVRNFHPAGPYPWDPVVYDEWFWSVKVDEKNTIELCDPDMDPEEKRSESGQSMGRTTLKLLSYKNGEFVMRGFQPFSYGGGMAHKGIFESYITITGTVEKDPALIEQYLSYEPYVYGKVYYCALVITGCVTDVAGNPVIGIEVKNDILPSCSQITDQKGEYIYKLVWFLEDGLPSITLTFEGGGYIPQSITYDYTDEHLIEDEYGESEYRREDGDVMLVKNPSVGVAGE